MATSSSIPQGRETEMVSSMEMEVNYSDMVDNAYANTVFCEVSRHIGDNWQPVFDKLVSSLPEEKAEKARRILEQDSPKVCY